MSLTEARKAYLKEYRQRPYVKANRECSNCDTTSDMGYVCFECEHIQVKDEYPNSKYTDDCQWVIPR